MALPEDQDEADRNQEAISGDGARDGRHPISTTDGFAGELPESSNADSLPCQAVIGSVGQTVTSVSGSEALGVVSKNSVRQQLGSLSSFTQEAILQDGVKDNANEHTNEVASSDRARECLANSTENPDEALNAPPLPLDSLLPSLPTPSIQTDISVVGSGLEDDSKVKDACVSTERELHSDVSHFAETHQHQQHQHGTSGYVSERSQSQKNSRRNVNFCFNVSGENYSHCRSQEGRVKSMSCRAKESKTKKSAFSSNKRSKERCTSNPVILQLSEEGVKELQLMSGTRRKPVHNEYDNFVKRLQSFGDIGCVDGVKTDILALAGFFYSGKGTATCYHCGCSPRMWTEGFDPKRLHWQLSPNCRFIRPYAKTFSRES